MPSTKPVPIETRRVAGKPRVHVTRRLLPETEARMAELFDVVLNPDDHEMSRDELTAAMADTDVLVPTVTDTIDAALIESAPPRLRLIANFGAGVDHIALSAARARSVMVTNTPGVLTDDTADMTLALILAVTRRLNYGGRVLRSGQWTGWAPSTLLGHRVGGRVLGIVGMGRIGQAVAHRARAFGLNVVYHSRHRIPEALETMLGVRHQPDLDALLAETDILTLHCPATRETQHLIDARRIALMKPGAFIINTARGQIVEEEAMIAALCAGHLGGAGLDVFEHEPLVDRRLRDHPNVAILPHMGSATVEGRIAAGEKVIANVRFWADGHRPPDQVLEGWR